MSSPETTPPRGELFWCILIPIMLIGGATLGLLLPEVRL